jgi:hypothetical protein
LRGKADIRQRLPNNLDFMSTRRRMLSPSNVG